MEECQVSREQVVMCGDVVVKVGARSQARGKHTSHGQSGGLSEGRVEWYHIRIQGSPVP